MLLVEYVVVPFLVAWWASEDTIAPTAVALDISITGGIVIVLIGSSIHLTRGILRVLHGLDLVRFG